jgi:hypothetical protein
MIPFPNKKYNTIVLDPPWNISMSGSSKLRPNRKKQLGIIKVLCLYKK